MKIHRIALETVKFAVITAWLFFVGNVIHHKTPSASSAMHQVAAVKK